MDTQFTLCRTDFLEQNKTCKVLVPPYPCPLELVTRCEFERHAKCTMAQTVLQNSL